MFVRVTSTPNSPRRAVKVVQSTRHGTKVSQKIVRHIGIALDEAEEEKLKQMAYEYIAQQKEDATKQQLTLQLKGYTHPTRQEHAQHMKEQAEKRAAIRGRPIKKRLEDILPVSQVSLEDIQEERRITEGVHDIAGHVYTTLGYDSILSSSNDKAVLKDLVLTRLVAPYSKHRLHSILDKNFAKQHDLNKIYRVLDKLHAQIDRVKTITFLKTKNLMPQTVNMVLFDVTTLYFESTETDELRAFGYSKDHRFNTTQVVLALATNQDGLPIGYELFSGNTAEVTTLCHALDKWKQLFNMGEVCFIGDRAMFCEKNIQQLEQAGYHYVIAAKLKKLPLDLQKDVLDHERYDDQSIHGSPVRVAAFQYNERRLIVSYKPERAESDQKQRQQVLDKIDKTLGKKGATQKLITNTGVKKYTSTTQSVTTLDPDKIALEARWDGLHGVITNITNEDPKAIIERYGRLWVIEESFRINKHTLAMRPIYHFKPERIQAHIALCFMTFSVLRHMQYHIGLTAKISAQHILDELMAVQASIYVHKTTGDRYRVPGVFSHAASKIYNCFGLQRALNASPFVR